MDEVKIAKNLLLNRICDNCEWSTRNDNCYFYTKRAGLKPTLTQSLAKDNTCEHWTEPSAGHRGGKENYK